LVSIDPRRVYLLHPRHCRFAIFSKYPSYPLATVAFQKVSFAYDILSKPSSRRTYDLYGITPDDPSSGSSFANGAGVNNFSHPSYTARADETLSGVLLGVFCDFMEGDFEMLRTFLREFLYSV
jgi:curved DNA-binding protein CbpA